MTDKIWHEAEITIKGDTYDLSHLFKLDTEITLPETRIDIPKKTRKAIEKKTGKEAPKYNIIPSWKVRITVRFSVHCYSIKAPTTLSNTDDTYLEDHFKNPRQFCSTRYELSKQLRDFIVNELPSRTCQFTKNDNWLAVELVDGNGKSQTYYILFTISQHQRHNNALHLRISSAYIKENPEENKKKRSRSKFATIARKTLNGEKVVRP